MRHTARPGRPRATVGVEDRFWPQVAKKVGGGHWHWLGAGSGRVGRFKVAGKLRQPKHIAWELERGPLPDGTALVRRCDDEECIRPAHHLPTARPGAFRRRKGAA